MSCSKRRIISLMVSLLMIVSLVGLLPMKNEVRAEITVPTLNSISVSPAKIAKGNNSMLEVTLNVNNVPTGIDDISVSATPLFGEPGDDLSENWSLYLQANHVTGPVTGDTIKVYIPIDSTVKSGKYQINSVEFYLSSGANSRYKANINKIGENIPQYPGTIVETDCKYYVSSFVRNLSDSNITVSAPTFEVTGADAVSYKPELTSLKMESDSVNAPGSINLDMEVSNSDPCINGYRVEYFLLNENASNGLNAYIVEKSNISPSNGKYVVSLPIDKNYSPGKYQITAVTLYDSLGEERRYNLETVGHGKPVNEYAKDGTYFESTNTFISGWLINSSDRILAPKFTVTGGTSGPSNTELVSVNLESSTVNRPGVARVNLKVNDPAGVNSVEVIFCGLDGAATGNDVFSGNVDGIDVKDGTITVDVPIRETVFIGKYQPSYVIFKNNRNISTTYKVEQWRNVDKADYASKYSGTYDEGTRTFVTDTLKWSDKTVKAPSLTLTDIDDYYLRASNQNSELANLINQTPEGSAFGVHIDDNSNGVLPKAAFDAIKGRDITLIAYKDSYQWVFYGKDITSDTKDVVLFLDIEQVDKNSYGLSEDAVKVNFYPNGTLPGKATIRLKSDYLYNLKGIKGNLYLYYNNNGTLELQDNPGFDLNLDGSDKWCSFNITHNSEYIIAGSEISGMSQPKYSNEWVNGKWYNADGTQTYEGTLEWKCNSTGWWVEDSTGWYPYSTWQKIDGKWYYFLDSGYMDYSEYRDGCWLGSDGAWIEDYYGGHWCGDSTGWWYEDSSGWYPYSTWLWIDGSCYYFMSDGYLATSQYVDGYWVNASGACE